jgi:hypothetical protein
MKLLEGIVSYEDNRHFKQYPFFQDRKFTYPRGPSCTSLPGPPRIPKHRHLECCLLRGDKPTTREVVLINSQVEENASSESNTFTFLLRVNHYALLLRVACVG